MKFSLAACGVVFGLLTNVAVANEDKVNVGVFAESLGLGANASYRFTDEWSARLEYAKQNKLDANRYGVDALYHIDNSPVYALVGLKRIDLNDSLNVANLGAGVSQSITEQFNVFVEAAWYEGLNESYTEFGMKLGLSYAFGNSSQTATVKSAPKLAIAVDSDNDSIYDNNDKCPNTPVVDAVDDFGCTLFEDKTVSIRLLVNFPNNSDVVEQAHFDDIYKVAEFLKANPQSSISLEGYASSVGNEKYNLALSMRRAKSVSKLLINEHQIDASRVETVAHGESSLVNDNNTQVGHAQNRRVEAFNSTVINVKVKR
jgi:OOP family OmpA-OmpF porin